MQRAGTLVVACGLCVASCASLVSAQADHGPGHLGYYRSPSLNGDTIVFTAEEDLWKVPATGGIATRLTSHPGAETSPAISPDGTMVAFTAQYEGPTDVYVMPLAGGLPKRLTFEGARRTNVVGWKPAAGGKPAMVMAATDALSTLPDSQLTLIDPTTGERTLLPLSQAAQGAYDDAGNLYFTRLAFQGSQTKRYKGGSVQTLWKFGQGSSEATPMTPDFPGTNANAMWWNGRVYFLTDRDGTMEIFSMKPDASDVTQETNHTGERERLLDVRGASVDSSGTTGRFVYQMGADLWVYDAGAHSDTKLNVRLDSDFDQTREKWIKKPFDYLSAAAISPDGSKAVLTARGQVFTIPKEGGRLAEVSRAEGVRYRNATWMPDGKSILALSDESGEVEFWTLPPNGVGKPEQLTTDGGILRWEGVPSPDGKKIAHHDKNQKLWIFDVATKTDTNIDINGLDNFSSLAWSPDSRWLSYVAVADNFNHQVKLYDTTSKATTFVTTDRFDTAEAAWSPDGKWMYILSDRNINTIVDSPWGAMQPEPFFDHKTKVYAIALKKDERSPWIPGDEVYDAKKAQEEKDKDKKKEPEKKEPTAKDDAAKPAPPADTKTDKDTDKKDESKNDDAKKDDKDAPKPVEIDLDGLPARLNEVPVDPGNYYGLSVNDKRLFFVSKDSDPDAKPTLLAVDIANKDVEAKALVKDIEGYELSRDGKSLLIRKKNSIAIIDAGSGPNADLSKSTLALGDWTFPLIPREEWRQMFTDAWRLERDYFYDTDMHGVDWKAMKARYMSLVDRVACRGELSDVLAQMVGELSALHIFVYGGEFREGPDKIAPAALGAVLTRSKDAGGYVVEKIYPSDPDMPDMASPLARPEVNMHEGDVITMVNGRDAATFESMNEALRTLAGKQVLLHVKEKAGGERDVIVKPWSMGQDADLRYHSWEYTRRMQVEEQGKAQIGYLHLRAMGGENMDEFARGYYPVFNRQGLIIDVRHNRGGNIDSWILNRLIRKAWFYWQPRVGEPTWNMQQAFRGHVVVLCDELTASDGEAFSEGIKRLKIGPVIGTRTWGGEIWLSSSNRLVDGGIATAAEIGVYGPEGDWLIEGHGVEPDIVVDNLPHATFQGKDAQLEAAIEYLQKQMKEHPVEVPPAPRHPNKSFRGPMGNAPEKADK